MLETLKTLLVGLPVFVSTNIDDIFILLMFFGDPHFKTRQVILGQFLGMGCLILLSLTGFLVSFAIPQTWIGLLGGVPLAMGVYRLCIQKDESEIEDTDKKSRTAFGSKTLIVAAVTVSNGGDNVGVYLPLFAASTFERVILFIFLFFVLTAVWCWIGYSAVHHPYFGNRIKKLLQPLLPWVLIGLGIWILIDSESIRLLTNR